MTGQLKSDPKKQSVRMQPIRAGYRRPDERRVGDVQNQLPEEQENAGPKRIQVPAHVLADRSISPSTTNCQGAVGIFSITQVIGDHPQARKW